jgi:hypothetical protein
MGKTSRSETQNTYPAWLQAYLNPLIGGSAARVGDFQDQGWQVLQGGDYRQATKPVLYGSAPKKPYQQLEDG